MYNTVVQQPAFPGVEHVSTFYLTSVASGTGNASVMIDIASPDRSEVLELTTQGVLCVVWNDSTRQVQAVSRFTNPLDMLAALASLPKKTLLLAVSKGDVSAFAQSEGLREQWHLFGMPDVFKTLQTSQSFAFAGEKSSGLRNAFFVLSLEGEDIHTHVFAADEHFLGGVTAQEDTSFETSPGLRMENGLLSLDIVSEGNGLNVHNGVISMDVTGESQKLGSRDNVAFNAVYTPSVFTESLYAGNTLIEETGSLVWGEEDGLTSISAYHISTPAFTSNSGFISNIQADVVSTNHFQAETVFVNGAVNAVESVFSNTHTHTLTVGPNISHTSHPFIENAPAETTVALLEGGVYIGSVSANTVHAPVSGELVVAKSLHIGSSENAGVLTLASPFDGYANDQNPFNAAVRIHASQERGLEIHGHLSQGMGFYTAGPARFYNTHTVNGTVQHAVFADIHETGSVFPIGYDAPPPRPSNSSNAATFLTPWYDNAQQFLHFQIKTANGNVRTARINVESIPSDSPSSPYTLSADVIHASSSINMLSNSIFSFIGNGASSVITSDTIESSIFIADDISAVNQRTTGNMVLGNTHTGTVLAFAPALGNETHTAGSLDHSYITLDNGQRSGHANSMTFFTQSTQGMVFETPSGGFHFSSELKTYNSVSNTLANAVSYATIASFQNNTFIQPLPSSDSISNQMVTGVDASNTPVSSMLAWFNSNSTYPSLNFHVKQYNGVSHYASIPLTPQHVLTPTGHAVFIADNAVLNGLHPNLILINGPAGQTITLPQAYAVRGKSFTLQRIANGAANIVLPENDYFVGRTASNTVSVLTGEGSTKQVTSIGNQQWVLINLE